MNIAYFLMRVDPPNLCLLSDMRSTSIEHSFTQFRGAFQQGYRDEENDKPAKV